jgi:hypothetical protein
MKMYQVGAPAYGMIEDGFSSRHAAVKFAREWERRNGYGRGVAHVTSYED